MTQVIEVPGMGRVEFPDGMSDTQMADAIQRNLPTGTTMGRTAAPEKPSVAADVIKSTPGMVTRASAGLVGLPQTIMELIGVGADKVSGLPAGTFKPELPNVGDTVTKGYDKISEWFTGKPVYRPQTGPGRVADVIGQTVVGGPGAIVPKVAMGAAAGTAGEGARLAGVESPVALAVIQMLGGGAASLPFILRSVPAQSINEALKNITPAHLAQAQTLMDDAARMGAPLTGAEAIAQVTGKNTLQDIQRVVESSRRGAPVIQPTMNERPAGARAAFEAAADQVAPMPQQPARTPARTQQAAENAITTARQAGNAAARPDYDAAATQRVSSSEWNTLTQEPAAQKALQAVRQATEYGVSTEREGSIRWMDAAKRWLDAKIQEAPPAERRIWEQGRTKIVATADAASPEYARARATVAANRQNVVDPMQQSPVGDIATSRGQFKDAPAESAMRAQSEILMPQAPRALDPPTIHRTVSTLNKQDPTAARDFVRQNVQAIFDESAQNLSGGANQWGGAKFAAQVAGNPRQRDNLQALVESVSNRQTWVGFSRMLEVMEAQGKRHAPGSQTAFNQQLQADLSMGGMGAIPAAISSPNKAMSAISLMYDRFRFGKNTAEMARILTDPRSVELMAKLAREAPDSARAAALTAQIIALNSGDESSTSR